MMLQLYFDNSKFPRTTTRKEWKEIWRWKRVTEQQLEESSKKYIEVLKLPNLPEHIRVGLLDRIMYPPILVHDKQGMR